MPVVTELDVEKLSCVYGLVTNTVPSSVEISPIDTLDSVEVVVVEVVVDNSEVIVEDKDVASNIG